MEYEQCIRLLDTFADEEGNKEDVSLRSAYPAPSAQEWQACLREVSDAGEDITNPFHCIGPYELQLAARGIPTVLARVANELASIAQRVGVPRDQLPDVLALYEALGDRKQEH